MPLVRLILPLLASCFALAQNLQTKTVDDSYDYSFDRPDGIQYSSNWQTVVSPSRFNSTVHLTNTHGSSLVYFFQGNSIYYFVDPSVQSAQVRIHLDDGPPEIVPANASTGPRQPLWSKTGLSPGDHQVKIKHVGINGRYIGLDYFRIDSDHDFAPVTTGPGASSVPKEALIVDSTSPSLVYSGNWTTISSDTELVFYGGSMQLSQTPGSTVTFKFNGTAVWYYAASFLHFAGTTKIYLDGGEPDVISTHSANAVLQREFWSKTGLADGEHTVLLEHAAGESTYANVDFFKYLPSQGTSNPPPAQQKPSSNVGAIIGGIIAGLGLIVILALALLYVRRRRRNSRPTRPDLLGTTVSSDSPSPLPAITPFEPPSPHNQRDTPSSRSLESPVMSQARPSKGLGYSYTSTPQRFSSDQSALGNTGHSESGRMGVSSPEMAGWIQEGPPPYER